VVDFIIVLAAFIVEIFLEDIFATFIILFRLWRMVRIMHGIYMTVEENRMHKIEKLKDRQHDLKHTLRDLTEERDRLLLLLRQHEAKGDEAKGHEAKGDEAKGHEAKGDEAKGDEAKGHVTRGARS
jgi:ABC-type nickel/cobalt efflux system permease component RcnA